MWKKLMMLMLMSVLLAGTSFAAAIPVQKDGLIQDDAKLFTAGEVKKLEAIAAGEALTFHVLTLDSLMGEDPSAYAKRIYNSWGLSSKDVLLLIANEEGHVELNFKYTALQKQIDLWGAEEGVSGSAALTQVLDSYFIPSAMEGSLGKAASTLMEGVHTIAAPLGIQEKAKQEPAKEAAAVPADPPAAPKAPTEQQSSKEENVSVSSGVANEAAPAAVKQPSEPREPISAAVLVIAVVIILAIGAAVILFIGWTRRKELNEVNEKLSDLMVDTNRVLETASRFHGIAQGETGLKINNSVEQLTELMIEVSRLQTEITSLHLSLFRIQALQNAALHYAGEEQKLRPLLEREAEQVAAIDEAEKTAKAQIQQLREETAVLAEKRQGIISGTGYALAEIVQRFEQLGAELAKAEELELFDPVASLNLIEQAERKLKGLEKDLIDTADYVKRVQELPERVSVCRQQVAKIIELNSLYQIKVKPYEQLEQSEAELEKLKGYLDQGDLVQVRSTWEIVDSLIINALAMTERQAMLRQKNREDLDSIDQRLIQFGIYRDRIRNQFVQTETRYAAHHWKGSESHLDSVVEELEEWQLKLPEIRLWSSDQQQEFDKARAHLDRLLQEMNEAETVLQSCTELFRRLDERLQDVENEILEIGRGYDSTQEMLGIEGIPVQQNQSINRSIADCLELFREWNEEIVRFPLDLDHLDRLLEICRQEVNQFINEAEGLLRQKRELQHYMADIDRRMQHVSSAGRFPGIKELQQNYNSYRPNVDHLMRSGMFNEALRQLQFLGQGIERMEESIRIAQLAQEQRRREAEQRRYQAAQRIRHSSSRSTPSSSSRSSSSRSSTRSHSTSSSPSSSSTSSHSSGGSSFKGRQSGGGTSGGTSFKSGGGNHSSGGSSWKK